MDEMADTIRAVVAGADWDIQVEPRMVLNPTTPSIDIYPGDPSRDPETAAFGDIDGGHWFNVRARVSPNDHEANQEVLLAFLDDEDDLSIGAALMDDPTLNGHASGMGMESPSGFVLFPTVTGTEVHIGVLWRVLVIPARS